MNSNLSFAVDIKLRLSFFFFFSIRQLFRNRWIGKKSSDAMKLLNSIHQLITHIYYLCIDTKYGGWATKNPKSIWAENLFTTFSHKSTKDETKRQEKNHWWCWICVSFSTVETRNSTHTTRLSFCCITINCWIAHTDARYTFTFISWHSHHNNATLCALIGREKPTMLKNRANKNKIKYFEQGKRKQLQFVLFTP